MNLIDKYFDRLTQFLYEFIKEGRRSLTEDELRNALKAIDPDELPSEVTFELEQNIGATRMRLIIEECLCNRGIKSTVTVLEPDRVTIRLN